MFKNIKGRLTTIVLWAVYLLLLGVLLPHTAWAFSNFEPTSDQIVAWCAALAFEAAIAALTHKLSKKIEATPRYTSGRVWLRKFAFRYGNAYFVGLSVAIGVSTAANLAHSVEFGSDLAIFGASSLLRAVYSVAFGAILPFCSLLFAWILSDIAETEQVANPELIEAKTAIKELRSRLKESSAQIEAAELRANEAEQRFGAAGDLFAKLFAQEKRARILAINEYWPQLPQAAIAIMAEASAAHVSEVLRESET